MASLCVKSANEAVGRAKEMLQVSYTAKLSVSSVSHLSLCFKQKDKNKTDRVHLVFVMWALGQ